MLLNKNNKFWTKYLIVLIFFFSAHYSFANEKLDFSIFRSALDNLPEPNNINSTEEYIGIIFKTFANSLESNSDKINPLVKKWENYLNTITFFSNMDYLSAIESQQKDYLNSIADLNKQIKNVRMKKNDYSSEWINDVENHFGKNFIKNNKEAVLNSSLAISNNDYHQYEDELKNMIYSEAMLYGSYKKYFDLFLDFFNEELNDNERKELKLRRDAADAFLSLLSNTSLTSTQETTVLNERAAENKANRYNEKLLIFLKGHPISNAYNVSKAVKDIIKATEN